MKRLAVLVVLLPLLTACPPQGEKPAEITVVTVVDGCQEDDPCWPCTPKDDACETRG